VHKVMAELAPRGGTAQPRSAKERREESLEPSKGATAPRIRDAKQKRGEGLLVIRRIVRALRSYFADPDPRFVREFADCEFCHFKTFYLSVPRGFLIATCAACEAEYEVLPAGMLRTMEKPMRKTRSV
jgi:hypothetical protein